MVSIGCSCFALPAAGAKREVTATVDAMTTAIMGFAGWQQFTRTRHLRHTNGASTVAPCGRNLSTLASAGNGAHLRISCSCLYWYLQGCHRVS